MDKVRKIAISLWENKERAVLGVMVIFLAYRGYVLINPPEPPEPPPPVRPSPTGEVEVPEPDFSPPDVERPQYDRDALVRRNPFWTNPYRRDPAAEREQRERPERPEVEITLDRITEMPDGSYRARLSRGRSRSTVEEGDTFQGYEVLRIDGEDGSVELYHEETRELLRLDA